MSPEDAPSPRLRAELQLQELGGGSLKILDPWTQRAFRIDAPESDVLAALDGERSTRQIAEELLGGPEDLPALESFVEWLAGLALLEQGLSAGAVSERQGSAVRALAQAERDEALTRVIRWAGASIPLYRERFGERANRVHGAAELPLLPTLTKRDVRENFPGRLLPDGSSAADLLERGEVWLYSTSGTTGDRLQVFYDAQRAAYPESFPGIAPVRERWAGARIALFTTPVCSGAVCHMGATRYEDRLLHGGAYLSLSSSDRVLGLTRPELLEILADLERFAPSVLRVDPVYAVALVRALEREGLPIPEVEAVWTAYEYCSVLHRPLLERAFGVPVVTVYAATDLGGGCQAFRCERGVFHVWQEQYVFEFLRDGAPVRPGELGEIAVTSLAHRFMPLVRYRVEDLGRPLEGPCSCAHGDWPGFALEGRLRDCMRDGSGRLVTTRAFDELFEGLSWIDFYRVEQRAAGDYELLVVRRPGSDGAEVSLFLDRARALLGSDARVRIREVREIPTEKSFKFRLTGSALAYPEGF